MNEPLINNLAIELANKITLNNQSLSLAESCTGGWLSKVLTDISGSSQWFLGGVVSYSNAAKASLLQVDSLLIDKYGAVSKQVAEEMAEGSQQAFSSSLALSITGVAGPLGGTSDKPVGLVWFATISSKNQIKSVSYNFKGNRDDIRRQAVAKALELLIELAAE